MQEQKEEREINLKDLFRDLLKYWWVIVLATVIIGVGALIWTSATEVPMYRSTTSIYVLTHQATSSVTYSDLQMGTELTKDYESIVESRSVLENVIKDLDLECSYESLLGKVTVSNKEESRIVSISAIADSPYEAQRITKCIQKWASKRILEVMGVEGVNTVDEANFPKTSTGSMAIRNGLLGALAGLAITLILLVLRYINDDSLKSEEDIKKYLGLTNLASIPDTKSKTENRYGRKE